MVMTDVESCRISQQLVELKFLWPDIGLFGLVSGKTYPPVISEKIGKITVFFMGKLTISIAFFNSKLFVITRG